MEYCRGETLRPISTPFLVSMLPTFCASGGRLRGEWGGERDKENLINGLPAKSGPDRAAVGAAAGGAGAAGGGGAGGILSGLDTSGES